MCVHVCWGGAEEVEVQVDKTQKSLALPMSEDVGSLRLFLITCKLIALAKLNGAGS